jgi:Rieske Fe-S protein
VLYGLIPHAEIDRRWSGQVTETNDGLPYIGLVAENQHVATGYAGNGMTYGMLAATILSDQIQGKDNPWLHLFDPNRKKLHGGTLAYLKENTSYPYYLLKDRLTYVEGRSTDEVARGEGKVLSLGGERVACSRGADGRLEMVSAVCTHMGCLVHWNNAEKTWDCPCHGSRFHPSGKVFAGPAETPLAPVKHSAEDAAPEPAGHSASS